MKFNSRISKRGALNRIISILFIGLLVYQSSIILSSLQQSQPAETALNDKSENLFLTEQTNGINPESYERLDYASLFETTKSDIDKDGNGVSDALDSLRSAHENSVAQGNIAPDSSSETDVNAESNEIKIICSFQEDISSISSLFHSLNNSGIVVNQIWNSALYGFTATLSFAQFQTLESILIENGLSGKYYIEQDVKQQAQMYVAAKQMNVRPYVWDTLGYIGDWNSSIAIIDTGIDDTHTNHEPYGASFTTNKIVGWRDSTGAGFVTPIDDNSHGSHCAGIAAGAGFETVDAQNRLLLSVPVGFNLTGMAYGVGSYVPIDIASFNVTAPGQIFVESDFWDETNVKDSNGHVYGQFALLRGASQVNISNYDTSASWSDKNISYSVGSSQLGMYKIQIIFEFANDTDPLDQLYNPDFYYAVTIHQPYTSPTDSWDVFTGIAYNSSLVGIKVLDKDGSGSGSWVIDGINWAVANRQTYHITVLSLSLGGPVYTMAEYLAVEQAVDSGLVVVVAAGNDGSGGNTLGQPGNADSVITVAALNYLDNVTSYSSQGGESYTGFTTKPDIASPGGTSSFPIYSTDSNDQDGFFSDQYADDARPMQGTSMATPTVSGAAALLVDALGGQTAWKYNRSSANKIKNLLLMTATETNMRRESDTGIYSPQLNRGTKDIHEGYGRINVDAAISAATLSASLSTTYQDTLYSSKLNVNQKHAWARQITLSKGIQYNFTLDVPSTGDFDIFLYNATGTKYGDPVIVANSTKSGNNVDESLCFRPNFSGLYYIVIKAVSGYGQFTLDTNDHAVPQRYNSNVRASEGASEMRTISINITDQSALTIWAVIEHYKGYGVSDPSGEIIETIRLYDDGSHHDKGAGDGIYADEYNVSKFPTGRYFVDFVAYDAGLSKNITYPTSRTGFYVGADNEGPSIYITPTVDTIYRGNIVTFSGKISDISGVTSASVSIYTITNSLIGTVTLYDDGKHSDGFFNDTVWGNSWNSGNNGIGTYYYTLTATDSSVASNVRTLTKFGYLNITETPTSMKGINYVMEVNASYSWVTGLTSLGFNDDDYATVTLGHSFQFYDEVFTKIFVSSNGYIALKNPTPNNFTNVKFPSYSTNPNATWVIAPLWSDLYMTSASADNVFYRTDTECTVIEWRNVDMLLGGYPFHINSFEVILFKNGTIKFQYNNLQQLALYGLPTSGINRGIDYELSNSYYQLDQAINTQKAVVFRLPAKDENKPVYQLEYPFNNEIIWGRTLSLIAGDGLSNLNRFGYRIYNNDTKTYVNNWRSNLNLEYTLNPGHYILVTNGTDLEGNIQFYNYTFTIIGNMDTTITNLDINSNLKIELNWTQAQDTLQYLIYRSTSKIYPDQISGMTPYLIVNDPTNESFIDSDMTEGRYFYIILTNNTFGTSWISNQMEIGYFYSGLDSDDDGTQDYDEYYLYGTDPFDNDTDNDGLNDTFEINNNPPYDPLDPDVDDDGLLDGIELEIGTLVNNNDTDGDNLTDGYEYYTINSDPLNNDTDDDGLYDGDEVLIYGTSATDNDTDNDELLDGDEVLIYGTLPGNPDSDDDGLDDGMEVLTYGTDPLLPDTDGDTFTDGEEVAAGTDPLDPTSFPILPNYIAIYFPYVLICILIVAVFGILRKKY
jgi:subtilisin family serine protease